MSDTKEKTTTEKNNQKNSKKKDAPKAKRMTKAEKAALEREQARLAAEKEERAKERRAIKDELTIIVTIAIAVLLVLSNFKLSGIAGEYVKNVLFGLFGFLAYTVPVLLVLLVCFFVANKKRGLRFIFKTIASFLIFVFMAALFHLAFGKLSEDMTAKDFYDYSSTYKIGGGMLGGMICKMLVRWFDVIGSCIILATLAIICLFFLSGRALLKAFSDSVKERNARKMEKRREINELYDEYLTTEEAEEYLESKKTSIESMLPGNHEAEGSADPEYDTEEEVLRSLSDSGVKLPVDYPEETQEEIEEREFEESLKKKHWLGRKEKKGKPNFFGGSTETKPFAIPEEENTERTEAFAEELSKVPAEASDTSIPQTTEGEKSSESIYEEELNKKFFGKKEPKAENDDDNIAVSIFKPRAEVREYVTDGEEDIVDRFEREQREEKEEEAKKEMSFSETSLRDKEFSYDKEEIAKTMDSVPYALSGAANRPLQYRKPVREEEKNEAPVDEEPLFEDYAAEDTSEDISEEPLFKEEPKSNLNPLGYDPHIFDPVDDTEDVAEEPVHKEYVFPPIELLDAPVRRENEDNSAELAETAEKLQRTLDSFGVKVTISNVQRGPSVTRYEIQPEVGVKVSRITNLADDIKLNLAAADIRIEAPIPGKAAVGIEVPNRENTMVTLRELVESDEFANARGKIPFTVGKSIDGANIIGDIAKMPHLMIAGSTGSGKSVCINTIIMSILYEFKPEDVKLIMIDPKVVELSVYNGIPHLLIPVVTDPKKAAAALNWACVEMDERYKKFAELSVRDLKGYNERVKAEAERGNVDENYPLLPQMVIIVDELADLMMVASNEVEDSICRLAQKARACGMHLIIATQRPSVNVITGLIKANIPSRIAFAVSSGVDSRTILDNVGAEKLLGKGDMLYYPTGMSKPVRIQGCFVSDKEVNSVVEFITKENDPAVYNEAINDKIARSNDDGKANEGKGLAQNDDGRDEYFEDAGRLIIEKEKASIGMLQRAYKIGFNRAARIMDQLADAGVVSEEDGNKPRQILMSSADYENMLQNEQ